MYGAGIRYGYIYDAEGNGTAKGTISPPAGATNAQVCDPTQNNFSQTNGYVVGPSGEQLTETGSLGNWLHTNVWVGGKLIATYDGTTNAPALHYHIDDSLGTRRAQTNAAGLLEATYHSLPYGDGYNASFVR